MRKIGKKSISHTAVSSTVITLRTYCISTIDYQFSQVIYFKVKMTLYFYSCKYDTLMQWHAGGKGAHPPSGDIFKPEIKANSSDIYEDLRTHQFPTWGSNIKMYWKKKKY